MSAQHDRDHAHHDHAHHDHARDPAHRDRAHGNGMRDIWPRRDLLQWSLAARLGLALALSAAAWAAVAAVIAT
ncbi:MAG: hypothetical protein JNK11_02260 [Alphaproteobacteria bacterium]|nr:hypothetical protein [Alphaproteobacteria bacterium]